MTKQEEQISFGHRARSAFGTSLRHCVTPSLRAWCLGGIVAAFTPAVAHALEIERAEAHYADKYYVFEFVALLDAPADKVEAVLRDYDGYPQLDARILEAHVLERPAEYAVILATTLRACFGPFCRSVKRVERVEESPLELKAVTDPAQSDVKFGETRTMLSVSDGRTRVSYRTSIIPGFWIPAIAGRRWMLNELRDATIELFGNVETEAKRSSATTDGKQEAEKTVDDTPVQSEIGR